MGSIFNVEGKLMMFLTKVSDVCLISFLWVICSLPIVTFGASTTAAYYTIVKVVRRQTGVMHKEFFRSFKSNFKDAGVLNLVYLLVGGIMIWNLINMFTMSPSQMTDTTFYLFFFYIVLFCMVVMSSLYTYPALSRFTMGRFQLVRFSVFAMFRHMPTTLAMAAMFAGCFLLMIAVPIGVIFMPGICLYGYSFFMERILRKYMTEEMRNIWDGEEAVAGQQ